MSGVASSSDRRYVGVPTSTKLHVILEEHLDVGPRKEADPLPSEPVVAGLSAVMRSLLWTVYVPTFLLSLGNSFTFPTLPVYARFLGLDSLALGSCMASTCLGRICTNLFSGFFTARCGVRATMVLSFLLAAVGALACSASVGFWSLFLGLFIMGGGQSLEAIGRMTYAKKMVSNQHRGRVVAVLGGTTRMGAVFGPAVSGVMARHFGLQAPFGLQVVAFLLAAGLCAVSFPRQVGPDSSPESVAVSDASSKSADKPTYSGVWQEHRSSLILVGVGMFVLMLLRESRNVLVPLYGDDMHVATDRIGFAVSASYLLDSCLFPVVGHLSDKYGRKAPGRPAFMCLTLGLLGLAAAGSFPTLVLAALLVGFGNGLSSGLVMITGGDLAPPQPQTGLFMGLYGGFYDGGAFCGPVLIGLTAHWGNFKIAGFAIACMGIFGTTWYVALVPETFKRAGADQQEAPAARISSDAELAPIALGEVVGKSVDDECDPEQADER